MPGRVSDGRDDVLKDPLEELLVDGEAEVAAGRGHWPEPAKGKRPQRGRADAFLRYKGALLDIARAKSASADRLREIVREALEYGRTRKVQ